MKELTDEPSLHCRVGRSYSYEEWAGQQVEEILQHPPYDARTLIVTLKTTYEACKGRPDVLRNSSDTLSAAIAAEDLLRKNGFHLPGVDTRAAANEYSIRRVLEQYEFGRDILKQYDMSKL